MFSIWRFSFSKKQGNGTGSRYQDEFYGVASIAVPLSERETASGDLSPIVAVTINDGGFLADKLLMTMSSPDDDDQRRLEILRRYEILDTYPEVSFERLTRLVANIFGTPIALISLVDETRQWFKSHHGLDASETPIHLSFCKHAIEEEGVFVVKDATKDERFAMNSLVTGDPGIRFYAGAPLRTPTGVQVGTLCVIDRRPRRALLPTEKQMLADLAALVVDEMELRLALRQIMRPVPMSPDSNVDVDGASGNDSAGGGK